jgi:hypothetical protein
MSLPTPSRDILAAIAAASPPELPPTDLLFFQGFKHLPQTKLFESKFIANCGRLVLTKGIIPPLLIALDKKPSYLIILVALTVTPTVDVVPSSSMLSFSEIGTP